MIKIDCLLYNKNSLRWIISTTFISLLLSGCSSNSINQLSQQDNADINTLSTEEIEQKFDHYYGQPSSINLFDNNEDELNARQLRERRSEEARQRAEIRRKALLEQLKANAPKAYIVKKGDTLWDIAKVFLKDPSYWPEIWDKNQRIKNPHLIYPGDKLYIFSGKGSRDQWLKALRGKGDDNGFKLLPRIRIDRGGSNHNPIDAIKPFMSWPRIVNKHDLSSAPYIVDARDAKLLIESGRVVYIRGLQNTQSNKLYGVYHAGKEIIDPKDNHVIGKEITYKGTVRVQRSDNMTTGIVESVTSAIRIGDRLIALDTRADYLKFSLSQPNQRVRGTIISLFDANMIAGQRMVAIVNIGSDQGLVAGNVVAIYSPPRSADDPYIRKEKRYRIKRLIKPVNIDIPISGKMAVKAYIPPERVGSMVIYHVEAGYAYGVIHESSHDVRKGYKIGNP